MRERESLHLERLERILFNDPAGTPLWLRESSRNCKDRYSEIQLTDQFKAAINAFDDEDNPKPFELFVLGEGKFGKSTVVNCLLGEELSKVQGLPETRCFHRYIFKDNPSDYTNLYLRTKPVMHDWLTSQLEEGNPIKDLFEILEYQASHKLARELVKQDVSKQEKGGYEQAIYEIERDVKRNDFSPFKREIRVVDTQGLDQLFPDDIKSVISSNEESSRESCHKWMRDTPRGLHLDWQFRRCDAVLWCINSKRLGSAATLEYLNYFSDYSKKIVIALTHIDIARNDKDRERLMAKAQEKYAQYSDMILPINGKEAWESISKRDQSSYRTSGMKNLVSTLVDVCDRDGIRVRNIARYKGLRQTEKQYRKALETLKKDYVILEEKYSQDLDLVKNNQDKTKREILRIVLNRGSDVLNEILPGVDLITLKDDVNDAENKLQINSKSRMFRDFILHILDKDLLPEISKLNDRITPYQIASFDADGEKAGHMISHFVDTLYIELDIVFPKPQLQLSNLWGRLADKFDSFLGLFSDEAKRRKLQRVLDLQNGIQNQLTDSWGKFLQEVEGSVSRETDRQYENLLGSIHEVMDKITSYAGDTLPRTINKIEDALSGVAVPNVIINKMLQTFKHEYGLHSLKQHLCRKSGNWFK
jgi:hypothetical protein